MTRVGVDVGGTFTDLVAVRPDGSVEIRKVASTPDDPSVGMFRALDALGTGDEGRGTGAALPPVHTKDEANQETDLPVTQSQGIVRGC